MNPVNRPFHGLQLGRLTIRFFGQANGLAEQLAETLCLSYFTVPTHRKSISQKLPFTTKKAFYDFLETLE